MNRFSSSKDQINNIPSHKFKSQKFNLLPWIFVVLLSLILVVISYFYLNTLQKMSNLSKRQNNATQSKPESSNSENENTDKPVKKPHNVVTEQTKSEIEKMQKQSKSKYDFVVIKNEKIRTGEEFVISSDARCTSDIKAKLISVAEDSVIIQPLQAYKGINEDSQKWMPVPEKDAKPTTVENNTCIYAQGLCMGGSIDYCFQLYNVDNILNIDYEAKLLQNPNSPYNNPPIQ